MNFLSGQLQLAAGAGATVRLRTGETVVLPWPEGASSSAAVTLGVRAEHLTLSDEGLAGRVAVEWLGNTRFAYLDSDIAEEPLVIQLGAGQRVVVGELVHVRPDEAHCHLFGEDGRTLAASGVRQAA
jgi:multiple sugar transport system ATP-binding protein